MTPHARAADMTSAVTGADSSACAQRPPQPPGRPPVGVVGVVAGLLFYSARVGNAQCVFYGPFRIGDIDKPTLWNTWPDGPPRTLPGGAVMQFEQARRTAARLFAEYRAANPRHGMRHNER